MALLNLADTAAQTSTQACAQLEDGNILFWPHIPFDLAQDDIEFLLSQNEVQAKYSSNAARKNFIYDPHQKKLLGMEATPETERIKIALQNYSQNVATFLQKTLAPYASSWVLGSASFRPEEERGRDLQTLQRNDLLHTDAFKTTPIDGGRILRFFCNINPTEPRVWNTSDAFPILVDKFAGPAGLSEVLGATRPNPLQKLLGKKPALRTSKSSKYNSLMLRFHDFLKESEDFQKNYPKERIEFAPHSSWMCFTDTVPHAALSGRFALEQTVFVPLSAMVAPEKSPARILEKMLGKQLVAV